jgi:PAS domain S-box-containing protein
MDDPSGRSLRHGLRAAVRRVDRSLPLLVKIAIPILLILSLAALTVGSLLVRDTRKHFTEAYDGQTRLVAHVVASRYREIAYDREAMTDFLEDLRRSGPLLLRIRLYRLEDDVRVVWATSGENLEAAGASEEVLEASRDGWLTEQLYPVGTPTAPAWVGLVVSTRALDRATAEAERQLMITLSLAALGSLLSVGLVLYLVVLRRAGRLFRAAKRVGAGDLAVRLPEAAGPPSRDALGNVAREFDQMLRILDARNRQQAAVAEFGQLALTGADVPTLVEDAVGLAARGLDVELASVLELHEDRFVIRAARGWPDDRAGLPVPLDSQARFTLGSADPVVLDDLAVETRFTPPASLVELGVRSGVSVVVPGPDGAFGVLAAHTQERRRFTADDAHFLQAMANSLGAAIRHRRTQREVADAEERYRTLVEQIPAVIYVDDDDELSTARYVSPYYETMFGYTPQERLSDPELWVKLLHPEDRERVLEESRRTNETGEPFRTEYRMIARDGRVVWVRDEAMLLRDDAGRTLGWQGVLFDITERKSAEEALRRVMLQNRLILDSAGEGIFGLDLEGRITFINPVGAEMLGWIPEELVGLPGHDAIHHSRPDGSPYPTDDCPIYAAFHDGLARRVDDEAFWRRDGTPLPVEYTSTPLLDEGRLVGAVVTFGDIIARKRAEETLRTAYDREREVAERLRQVDEMKNAFLSAVSHELRTPLSAVMGYALTLKQDELNLPEEERRELLDRLAANAQKLHRLLADLLDVDRMERGILEPQRHPVDLEALAQRIVQETDVRGRGVQLDVERLVADLDGPKIERILENLLVNAAKHTPPGTQVRVGIHARDGGVLIAVEDEGAGVPDELKESVFRPFERGPGVPTHAPGTGIGLSLVARFAELHGGRAWVEDRTGGGASFRVFIPAVISGNGFRSVPAPER